MADQDTSDLRGSESTMRQTRRAYSSALKAEVALAAISRSSTIAQLSERHATHRNQIMQWKKRLLSGAEQLFQRGVGLVSDYKRQIKSLQVKVGELTKENEFFREHYHSRPTRERQQLVSRDAKLSVASQCRALKVARSMVYYQPAGPSELELLLMRLLDKIYLAFPFYGVLNIKDTLAAEHGLRVSVKRIRRLRKLMGIQAIYPKPRTGTPGKGHKTYPYLLREMQVTRPNQVWAAGITYIQMARGYLYLVALIDWYSRLVLSWRLSNSMDVHFCLAALEEALSRYGKPEIFNTDQGSQFTSEQFTSVLLGAGVKISMVGKGRCLDNVFVERLWRSVKREEVYLHAYENGREARNRLGTYFRFYNCHRHHQGLGHRRPDEVYYEGILQSKAA